MELISMTQAQKRKSRDNKFRAYRRHVSDNMVLVRTMFEVIPDLIDVYVDDYERNDTFTKLAQIGMILCDRAVNEGGQYTEAK